MKIGNKRIEDSLIKLISDYRLGYQFYGEFLMYINFHEKKEIGTAGVNVSKKGMNFYYNEDFINSLTDKELGFLIIHEILHLQHRHQLRGMNYDKQLANISMDMIINHLILSDISKSYADVGPVLSKGCFLPKEYTGKLIFEELYDWLKDNPDKQQGGGKGDSDGTGNPFDEHLEDEVGEEYAREVVRDVVEGLRNRGISPGHMESMLGKIEKPKKDYIKEIQKHVGKVKGFFKEGTYSRRNRKELEGLKGNKKLGTEIVVLLDTSGSMMGDFEKVLSTIYKNNLVSWVVMVDTEVKKAEKVSCMKDVSKLKIEGFGGTILQPGINFVLGDKRLNSLPMLVLTDGDCDSLSFDGVRSKVLILSTRTRVNILGMKQVHQILL